MNLLFLVAALSLGPQPVADVAPLPSLRTDVRAKSGGFEPPAVLEAKGGFAVYLPPEDVKAAEYVALDGEEPFPASMIGGSPTAFVFFTRGLPAKEYRFVGIASDSGGKLTRKQFVVPVGTPTTPPGTPPPKKDPPVTAPAKYYFLVIRPDGPATAQFRKTMESPEWAQLRKDGHLVSDTGVTDAGKLGIEPPSILPCVVTLQESGKKSKIVRPPVALPSGKDILDLPKAVK